MELDSSIPLTPDELHQLFDAVYERDMRTLRKQQEDLKKMTKVEKAYKWKP